MSQRSSVRTILNVEHIHPDQRLIAGDELLFEEVPKGWPCLSSSKFSVRVILSIANGNPRCGFRADLIGV
jgi:hypothetical protein